MAWLVLRAFVAAAVVVAVAEVSNRLPRLGALLLTLPVVSVIAFVAAWTKDRDLAAVSRLSRETLVPVPLGLGVFVPLAFAERLGLADPADLDHRPRPGPGPRSAGPACPWSSSGNRSGDR